MALTGSLNGPRINYPTYNPKQGYDTIWETLVPGWRTRASNATADAGLSRSRAQRQYEQNIYDLGTRVSDTTRNTLGGLEGRGVLRSGETQVRLSDIAARNDQARARAAQALADAQNAATAQQNRTLSQIQVDQETARQQGLIREQQAAVAAWVAATNRNQQQAQQAALLRAIASRPAPVTRIVQVGGAAPGPAPTPAQAAGPTPAQLAAFYNAVIGSGRGTGAGGGSSFITGGRGAQ